MASSEKSSLYPSLGRAAWAVLIGAVGGAFFLFVFPGAAISTLMHQVLKLPGPGAGIGVMLGPVALVFMLVASRVTGRCGGALLAALGFSVVHAILSILFRGGGSTGQFGTGWFVLALLVCGVVAEGLLLLARRARSPLQFIIAACGANIALLVFYWLAIFPRTAGWVAWKAVPVLLLVSLACGIVAGIVGRIVSTRIPQVEAPGLREVTDVRNP
jgi:hypothetical protein